MFTKRLSSRGKQARERAIERERSARTRDESSGGDGGSSNVVPTPPLKPFTRALNPSGGHDRPTASLPTRPDDAPRAPRRPPTVGEVLSRPYPARRTADQSPPSRPAPVLAQPAVAQPVAAAGGLPTAPRPASWPFTRPSAMANQGQPAARSLGRVLAVGREIRLTGEIKTCDTLSVEGSVEGELSETRHLEIGQGGRFNGTAEVESAAVAGAFEGDLTVRGVLTLKASGRVSGSIRYGEIEIERGGRISGSFGLMGGGEPSRDGAASEAVALPGPRPA